MEEINALGFPNENNRRVPQNQLRRMVIHGNELNMVAAFRSFIRALADGLFDLQMTGQLVKPRELRQAITALQIFGMVLSAAGIAISLSLLLARGRRGRLMRRQFRWLRGFANVVLLATLVIRGFILVLAALSISN